MRIFLIIFLFLPIQFLLAQNAKITFVPLKNTGTQPWTDKVLNNSKEDFQFAIVTDRTGGHRAGVFMDAVNKLNLLQPEFVISVGDLIEGYTENMPELENQWNEFDGFVNQLEMPFFYVPGNHDITNQVMEDVWKSRLGDTYYSFIYKEVLFLCLNSEDQKRGAGRGTISDEQYNWIKATLNKNEDVKHTLVFMHQPLWTLEDTKRWNDVEVLLKNREHHVFTGHYHRYTKYQRNNGKYFVLATTGGSSSLRGTDFGEFDHVVWVTMKNGEPIIANLLLEGIWDENVMTNDLRAEIEYIQDKSPMKFELVYTDELVNNKKAFDVQITNDEDFPMHVRMKSAVNFDLILFGDKEELIIPPNSVEVVKMQMTLNKPLKSVDLRPVKLKAIISFPEKSETNIEIPFEYSIRPIDKNNVEKLNNKVIIDANLKEWKELNNIVNSDDPESMNARFAMQYDDEMLYLAVDVKDDNIMSFGSGRPWTQDYIGLCLNAENAEKSALSKGEGWYQNEMYFLITPEKGKNKSQTWQEDKLPEGSKYACKANEKGYTMEWAIPLEYIKQKQGEDWKTYRFNLFIGDKDLEAEDPKTYFWGANWRGEDNYLGSGMFFKNSK